MRPEQILQLITFLRGRGYSVRFAGDDMGCMATIETENADKQWVVYAGMTEEAFEAVARAFYEELVDTAQGVGLLLPPPEVAADSSQSPRSLYRDHKGGVAADPAYTEWLRLWLGEKTMWDLFKTLSNEQLDQLRSFLQSVTYGPDGTLLSSRIKEW